MNKPWTVVSSVDADFLLKDGNGETVVGALHVPPSERKAYLQRIADRVNEESGLTSADQSDRCPNDGWVLQRIHKRETFVLPGNRDLLYFDSSGKFYHCSKCNHIWAHPVNDAEPVLAAVPKGESV